MTGAETVSSHRQQGCKRAARMNLRLLPENVLYPNVNMVHPQSNKLLHKFKYLSCQEETAVRCPSSNLCVQTVMPPLGPLLSANLQ